MTGWAPPVRSARYSVWPEKRMPASLMTLFCTGAVTIAANSPAMQPSTGAIEQRQHVTRVGAIELAGSNCRRDGNVQNTQRARAMRRGLQRRASRAGA